LESTYNSATLLPRCANDGDQFLVVHDSFSLLFVDK